jgi:hypothetical protein
MVRRKRSSRDSSISIAATARAPQCAHSSLSAGVRFPHEGQFRNPVSFELSFKGFKLSEGRRAFKRLFSENASVRIFDVVIRVAK